MGKGLNVLCFVAHPDDETVFFGGTLALLARGGVTVDVVCATRGEGGEAGEPPVCARSDLGRVREGEMRCAIEVLGARSLSFLGYRDPEMRSGQELFAFTDRPAEAAERLSALLRAHPFEAVVTHGSSGEYGHPGHRMAHEIARLSVEQASDPPALYGFSASFPKHPRPRLSNPPDSADLVLDVHLVWEQKVAAARCHVTQRPVFVRRLSLERGYPVRLEEALMRVESLHRFLPAPLGPGNPDPFASWIRDHLATCLVQP